MVRGKTYHFQIQLTSGHVINTSQWAHHISRAQALLSKCYHGFILLQVVDV